MGISPHFAEFFIYALPHPQLRALRHFSWRRARNKVDCLFASALLHINFLIGLHHYPACPGKFEL